MLFNQQITKNIALRKGLKHLVCGLKQDLSKYSLEYGGFVKMLENVRKNVVVKEIRLCY